MCVVIGADFLIFRPCRVKRVAHEPSPSALVLLASASSVLGGCGVPLMVIRTCMLVPAGQTDGACVSSSVRTLSCF